MMGLSVSKGRESNLELYRIICMFLIVCHHYVVNSGLLLTLDKEPLSYYSLFYYVFGMWGKTGINCFVLITGYFMCLSNITERKFIKLVAQILFYNIIIYFVFVATGHVSFNLKDFSNTVWFVHGLNGSFVPCFMLFYLSIPFLNVLIHNINQKQHFFLIVLMVIPYSILALPFLMYQVTFNYLSWFCILYFISSYIRMYPNKYDKKKWIWVILSFTCILASILTVLWQVSKGMYWPYNYVCDCNQLLSLVTAITSFMVFKNIRMPQSKCINYIAATTFGILLIHANSDLMKHWLWMDVVKCSDNYNYPFYCICSCVIVFAVCSVLELLRIRIIEPLYLRGRWK